MEFKFKTLVKTQYLHKCIQTCWCQRKLSLSKYSPPPKVSRWPNFQKILSYLFLAKYDMLLQSWELPLAFLCNSPCNTVLSGVIHHYIHKQISASSLIKYIPSQLVKVTNWTGKLVGTWCFSPRAEPKQALNLLKHHYAVFCLLSACVDCWFSLYHLMHAH